MRKIATYNVLINRNNSINMVVEADEAVNYQTEFLISLKLARMPPYLLSNLSWLIYNAASDSTLLGYEVVQYEVCHSNNWIGFINVLYLQNIIFLHLLDVYKRQHKHRTQHGNITLLT